MKSKFGRQPVHVEIFKRGTNCRALARELDVSYGQLYGTVIGDIPPTEHLRKVLPEWFDMALEDLFTEEALAVQHRGRRGPRPGWREAILAGGDSK